MLFAYGVALVALYTICALVGSWSLRNGHIETLPILVCVCTLFTYPLALLFTVPMCIILLLYAGGTPRKKNDRITLVDFRDVIPSTVNSIISGLSRTTRIVWKAIKDGGVLLWLLLGVAVFAYSIFIFAWVFYEFEELINRGDGDYGMDAMDRVWEHSITPIYKGIFYILQGARAVGFLLIPSFNFFSTLHGAIPFS